MFFQVKVKSHNEKLIEELIESTKAKMIANVDDSNWHSNNEQDETALISSFSSLEELALGSVSFLLQSSKIYL